MQFRPSRYFPILGWARHYKGETFVNDAVAAVIVTIMLIPQSLAYAMLAGLPPQIGLYASILPLIAYAIFGTSRTLAVGPVAILSLMTAAAAGKIAAAGSAEYIEAALILAFLSGLMLLLLGVFRLGFLANFLSHPVISGFITASGIIIAASQLKHILGISAHGHTLPTLIASIVSHLGAINIPTVIIGGSSLLFLFWARGMLKDMLVKAGLAVKPAMIIARAGPVFAVIASIVAVAAMGLDGQGVRILGSVPGSLPSLGMPDFNADVWTQLAGSAGLIALIGFVESVSVAKTLAAKRRQRIDPNQELIALGAASLSAGISSGYPVTGGLARSAVNFDAGAETPAAGAFTAAGIALATLFLTPYLFYLPQAVLAATIIVAVLSLVDFPQIVNVWRYSKTDFAAMAATIVVTLGFGVELGVTTGVALSLFLHLYNTSRPHFAIVGQVPGTHHFRNVNRHEVAISPAVVTIRIDESLYFANARFLEDLVYGIIGNRPAIRHLVLMCPAVNKIDASALESLEAINDRLNDTGVCLHLSEVKGPVMDRLKDTRFLKGLTGKVFLDQFEAMSALDHDGTQAAIDRRAPVTNPAAVPRPSSIIAGVD
ncbi:SulP family inorganic anion transporter [Aquisalinus flavus]|uniref:Sodium-independent anion transporter n=1 Tax=Aquisalinus flavus TaxID=1526572 RepID=A0A8J2V6P0_9PROT|nr:sulfate permease [Aquisalinus flavus]MBD0426481.1 sulfate permease [Aquisalinus flavus]UNE47965.1 sulfate permease [Aquisalinus flavus]GGD07588.1 sodium-independent anion transporter [Aquisalinus flavus]